MLRRVVLVRIDVSENRSAYIIRMTRIDELGMTVAVTSNRRTMRRNTIHQRRWNSSQQKVFIVNTTLLPAEGIAAIQSDGNCCVDKGHDEEYEYYISASCCT
jgi:hypothetical protein